MPSESTSDYSLTPFFESSPDYLCIAGFDGYFKKINPAFRMLLGYSEEELMARPINDFVHPEDQGLTHQHRSNLWEGKPLLNFENRYLSKEGKVIWLSWNSMPHHETKVVYAIAKNISYIKENEKKRNQLLADLTRNNERLKQLNYATSHDIRSPVSNLLSVFNMLDTSKISDPETLQFIEILRLSSEELKATLDRYVDDLQQNDVLQVEVSEVSVREVLQSVMDSLSYLIRDAKATFDIDLEAFESVTFNYAYMESVLMNLVTNSIKYAHPDRDPAIGIRARWVDGAKQLEFTDNGLGFDSEKQKGKVFRLHQTFHDHSDSKGIGLYLVYNHIVSLGGRIEVESKVGEGTTFRIDFRS